MRKKTLEQERGGAGTGQRLPGAARVHQHLLGAVGHHPLLSLFPTRDFNPMLIERYNRESAFEFERIRDFIILHYHATERSDTPFWDYCRTMSVPETLRETMDLFRVDGRYFRNGEDFFALPSWVQVMLGQRIVPQGYHPMVDEMPEDRLVDHVESVRATLAQAVGSMPTHQEWMDRYWKAPAR
jgi:tryptophan halogenase